MRKLVKVSVWALALGGVSLVILMSASVYTFNRLTDETLIAEIRFEQTGPQRYTAYLRTGDLCEDQVLGVLGDQWRVDARFLKWRYWASLLGLDSQYRLERFEGRYRDVAEQNSRPTLAHDLGRHTAVDVVDLAQSLGRLNFLVDASYGSSTYEDIDPGRVYLVYKSPTGIFTRSREPSPSVDAEAGLAVEVTRACGERDGLWERVTVWTDENLTGLLVHAAQSPRSRDDRGTGRTSSRRP